MNGPQRPSWLPARSASAELPPEPLERREVDLCRPDELVDGNRLDVRVGAVAARAVVDGRDPADRLEDRRVCNDLDPGRLERLARDVLVAAAKRDRERVLGVDRV